MTTRRRSGTTRTAGVAAAATLALALALSLAGCSGDDGDEPEPDAPAAGSSAPPAAAPPLETTATIGRVTGSAFPDAKRETLKKQVRAIVDQWVDGAYVGGSWPRTEVADAFGGFTAGARRAATNDLRLMSNADIGDRVTAVRATKRVLRLDVLAVRKRAVSVTARVELRFTTTGEVARTETVRGRLFLTRGKQGWEVFGYDVTSGDGGGQQQKSTKDQQRNTTKQKKSQRKGSTR
jgi:hypothetical protein